MTPRDLLAAYVVFRLKLDAGRAAIAEWERDHGELTADELAAGRARARRLLDLESPTH